MRVRLPAPAPALSVSLEAPTLALVIPRRCQAWTPVIPGYRSSTVVKKSVASRGRYKKHKQNAEGDGVAGGEADGIRVVDVVNEERPG
jgi:hypothetical protein